MAGPPGHLKRTMTGSQDETDERPSAVVGTGRLQSSDLMRGREVDENRSPDAVAPVVELGARPETPVIKARENEMVVGRVAPGLAPFVEVVPESIDERDDPRHARLRGDELPVRSRLVNGDRAGADVAEGERERLAGTQAGVADETHEAGVTDVADTGTGANGPSGQQPAMSPDQIAANQLQIDSSLDAINRISQSTNFQGRKLIDGSLDFTTTHNLDNTVSNYNAVQNLEIDTADFGLATNMPVNVTVSQQAQQAYLATTTPTSTAGGFVVTMDKGSFSIVAPTSNPNNYDFANMRIQFASDSTRPRSQPEGQLRDIK